MPMNVFQEINPEHAAGPGMDREKVVFQPNIIVIIAIIVITVLSISRLIAIIGNNLNRQ